MKKENPGGFSFFSGAELRIRVKRGKVKRRHKKNIHRCRLSQRHCCVALAESKPYM